MDGLNILDLIILIIFLYFILRGYQTGFIRQTSKILGLIIALLVAVKQYQEFQVLLEPYLDVPPSLLSFISFAIIFIIFNLLIHILGISLKKVTNFLYLGPVDSFGGVLLGILKSGILIYLVIFILNEVPHELVTEMIEKSYFAKNILEFTPILQENLDKMFEIN